MAQTNGKPGAPRGKLFKSGNGLALILPKALANRYHLTSGTRLEIYPTDEGIFLRPIGVAPWFSIEWERAMDAVLERYEEALKALDE